MFDFLQYYCRSFPSPPLFLFLLPFSLSPTTKTVTSLLRQPLLPLATIPRSRRDDLSAVAPFKDFLFFFLLVSPMSLNPLSCGIVSLLFLAAADVISNANCGSGGAAIKKLQKKRKTSLKPVSPAAETFLLQLQLKLLLTTTTITTCCTLHLL